MPCKMQLFSDSYRFRLKGVSKLKPVPLNDSMAMALLFSVVVSKWGLFQYTMHFLLCNLNRYNSLSFIQYLNYVVLRPRGLALVLEILNWKLCYSCFAEGWSRAGVYQTRTNREGFVWWGLQGSRQSDPTSGGHQNNWLGRSWGWNWRHPTGNSSP